VLVGRSAERAAIEALLERARESRGGALVLRGEPGIGKTALLEDTQQRAVGMRVLTARGVESESDLSFAALHQLLRPVLQHMGDLPAPQTEALSNALGLGAGPATERFLVAAACLTLLSEMSAHRPVLCLVDDAHWLDSATSDALLFVARRLDAEPIVMLFAAREGDVRGFEGHGIPSRVVTGLDSKSAEALLEVGSSVHVARAVVDRLVNETHGNALALLELPSVLSPSQLGGDEPLPDALPMTRRVEGIFLERVRRLPAETQTLLIVAAADESGEVPLVLGAAVRLGSDERALDAAEQSELVSIDGLRLEFRHPLVRSAVYRGATSRQRRAAHRVLAAELGEDSEHGDRRAWHLASSALEPDEGVALAIEAVAARAQARAGYASASRALERAAELSPRQADRIRRLVASATAASVAGADARAVELAAQASKLETTAEQAAEIASIIGVAGLRRGKPTDAFQTLIEAGRDVHVVSPGKALELYMQAMWAAAQGADHTGQLVAAKLAATVASPVDDDRATIIASFLAGFAAVAEADPSRAAALLARGLQLASTAEEPSTVFTASVGALLVGDDEHYEALLVRAISLARARGELGTLVEALAQRAAQLLMLQRFGDATAAAEEAIELSRELHAENHILVPRAVLAAVDALRGRHEDARRAALEILEVATARGLKWRMVLAHLALGWLEMGHGQWDDALAHFDTAARTNPATASRIAFDQVESAARAGRLEHARDVTSWFESWAEQTGAVWARARVDSCRALVSDGRDATDYFEHALKLEDGPRPFDCARIHLLFGEHLRRERRRVDAREHLRAAIDGFERLQAEPWAQRARAELRASGETARKRDPSAMDQLTSQEVRTSQLVIAGLSNKQIAAQLFLSPRTIDAHLRSVFTKLGVTSRTQLALHLSHE
jgi:DNA-binding CsgD family transcriptional regulator